MAYDNAFSSGLDWYFQEIGKKPQLTVEEEQGHFEELIQHRDTLYSAINDKLGKEFISAHFPDFRAGEQEADSNRWRFLDDITKQYLAGLEERANIAMLTEEYRSELKEKKSEVTALYRSWYKTRNKIAEANLRLVVFKAKKRKNNYPLEEKIQDGNFGLFRAIDSFDPHRGFKFSTYAGRWIEHAIDRAYEDNHATIRLPVHVQQTLSKINRIERQCKIELKKEHITSEDIAAKITGIYADSPRFIEKTLGLLYPLEKVYSLEAKIGEEEDTELLGIIPNPASPNPEAETAYGELSRRVEKVISLLPAKEQELIRLRWGIGIEEHSLKEISEKKGLKKWQVRDGEHDARRKFKQISKDYLLEKYIDGKE